MYHRDTLYSFDTLILSLAGRNIKIMCFGTEKKHGDNLTCGLMIRRKNVK